ncbi:hypothetical protein J6590_001346 [Homalodisca vitripennis]|nr:hypothetical protein J6590_001346 [Homalodisca vitripennis]
MWKILRGKNNLLRSRIIHRITGLPVDIRSAITCPGTLHPDHFRSGYSKRSKEISERSASRLFYPKVVLDTRRGVLVSPGRSPSWRRILQRDYDNTKNNPAEKAECREMQSITA